MPHDDSRPLLSLQASAVVSGGDALARHSDGRVVFVQGALPGETVLAEITSEHKGYARARLAQVLEASPDRVGPPCPEVARGCGGCGWQHVAPAAQLRLKAAIVADNLRRLGHLPDVEVRVGPAVSPEAYRTTVRVAVSGGRAGFRRARSHDVVTVASCLVAHPLIDEMVAHGRFGAASQATLRCGVATGERLALLSPSAAGATLPPGTAVIGSDELEGGREAWLYEEVVGKRLRVSARSFCQSSTEGAALLVGAVGEAIEGAPAGRLVDAYGGVGLFAATLGHDRPVTLLETSPSSVADARCNLPGAQVLAVDVARWRAVPTGVVVADPPRAGLGRQAAAALAASGTSHLALVSCDPASLGRDAGLLTGLGFKLGWSLVVDLFPGTPHVETVTRFVR